MNEHQLFLCLGGNLGNKAEIFSQTAALIGARIGFLKHLSPLYTSPPWGFRARSWFWNQVAEVTTSLSPEEVLREIHAIEHHFGRIRKPGSYRSRKMDIDILFYDRVIMETPELTLPHPMIARRLFVLLPLADIAPALVHPVTGERVADMIAQSDDTSPVTRVFPS